MALLGRTLIRSKAYCYPAFICRNFHASHAMRDEELKKLKFRLDGFYRYGLLADDLLSELDPDVSEAIRRLPEAEQMQRKYRAIRAHQAELNNSLLPKDQWTKFEDNHNYLQPYIKDVKMEREEREEWEATH